MVIISRCGGAALAIASALFGTSSGAHADDRGYGAPSYAGLLDDRRAFDNSYRYIPAAQWAGLYVGGHLGAGFGSTDTMGSAIGDLATSGFSGGILGGYNIQLGSLVAGVEADIAWANIDGSESTSFAAATASHDWLSSVRARIGYATESWLVYATGGLAIADFNVDVEDFAGRVTREATPSGWVLGGGAEYAVSPQLSLRGEVLHYSFEETRVPAANLTADPDITTVRAGISMRFN
jgi:outer membrane immunogenic protein